MPVYVLEFLLGQYCSSDDADVIERGVESVKRILADNFVRPDEAQKILSVLRSRGSYTVIDKITVSLNIKRDVYEAEFSNLGLKTIPMDDAYPEKYDRLLCGGIWCIVQLDYEKEQYGDALDHDYRLGKNLNQRDTIAVCKMVGGFIKLLYPDGEYTKDQVEEILKLALEMRRRVKEQLKKLGGDES